MEPRCRFRRLLEDLGAECEVMAAENDRLRREASRPLLAPEAAQLRVAASTPQPEPARDVLMDYDALRDALPGQPCAPDERSQSSSSVPSTPFKEVEDVSTVRHGISALTQGSKLGPGAIGQFTREATAPFADYTTRKLSMHDCVAHAAFEAVFGVLILLNTAMLAVEMQVVGVHHGRQLECGDCPMDTALAMDQTGATIFKAFEFAFGVLFTIELVIKVVALKRDFWRSWWNLLDLLIVVFWLLEQSTSILMSMNPMVLRLARLSRLCRLGRMLKTISMFDSLNVMTGSIQACMPALFWSICLLFLVQVSVALALQSWLEQFIVDESVPSERRLEVHKYFGTFTRSMVTMFELSLANWAPACRLLMENVHESYGILILTFRVTSTDDELMVMQRNRASEKHRRKMKKLLSQADESHDGVIQREELRQVLKKPSVRRWLEAMDVEVADGDVLFDFLSNGRDELNVTDLVHGMSRLRGGARSIDVVGLVQRILEIQGTLEDLAVKLNGLQSKQASSRSEAAAGRRAREATKRSDNAKSSAGKEPRRQSLS